MSGTMGSRTGVAISGGPSPAEIVDLIVLAEQLGYDSAWVAEGHGGDQFAILAAATIPELTWRKGAYLQHRAQTLAYWMMLCMTFSYAFDYSKFAVKGSLNPTALFLVSFVALAWNVGVFVYHFAKVIKYRRNVASGVHFDEGEYKELMSERDSHRAAPPEGAATILA